MRPQPAPVRDGFGPLFMATMAAWSCASQLICGASHVAVGAIFAAMLAFAGTVAMHRAARRREEARMRAILTTPQEFPAIPVPPYLLPSIPPLYEAGIAAG